MRSNLLGKLAGLGVFFATVAEAQPQSTTPVGPAATPPAWTIEAGYESFWLRDVARTGPPVDGSPVSWEGEGPSVLVSYDRGRPHRLHHFEGFFAVAGDFSLETPVRSIPGPTDDGQKHFGGRYEYRRYPFRDLWLNGFDIGFGIEGSVDRLILARNFQPSIVLDTALTNFGTAGVLAARLRRARFDLTASWGNGVSIGQSATNHHADIDIERHEWGGGWQTTLRLRAAVRVASRAAVAVSYFNSGEGRLASHDTSTFGRSRFAAGVIYGQ